MFIVEPRTRDPDVPITSYDDVAADLRGKRHKVLLDPANEARRDADKHAVGQKSVLCAASVQGERPVAHDAVHLRGHDVGFSEVAPHAELVFQRPPAEGSARAACASARAAARDVARDSLSTARGGSGAGCGRIAGTPPVVRRRVCARRGACCLTFDEPAPTPSPPPDAQLGMEDNAQIDVQLEQQGGRRHARV